MTALEIGICWSILGVLSGILAMLIVIGKMDA